MTFTPGTVVRALFARLAIEDYEGVRDLLAADVVWYGTSGGLDANRVVRGPDEFLDYLQEIVNLWERLETEIERLIEADSKVVAFLLETARVSRGDLDVHDETAVTFEVRAGKIVEARGYLDRSEALDAAGVRE